jgi:hypothetical protein
MLLLKTTEAEDDLKVDEQNRPRPPTPFEEIPGSARGGSITDSPEPARTSALPDVANIGDSPGLSSFSYPRKAS